MRVAIQGEKGSFSHEAALQMEPEAVILPCAFSSEVFRLVADGSADAAVIPIENSLAGPVLEHYDLLLSQDVGIERESLLRIQHHLIAAPGASLPQIRRVLSHPVALAQCRLFLSKHLEMIPTPAYDTAGSVKQVVETGDATDAAIAGRQAAAYHGGEVLAEGIEDSPENFTRFFLIRQTNQVKTSAAADKVSVAFTVENRPGSLVRALRVFDEQGTNLTKIESRPVPGKPWQYIFYVDYQLSSVTGADRILHELKLPCSSVKELGRYRTAQAG